MFALHYASHSPYARKVRAVANERNLASCLELVDTDTWQVSSEVYRVNPLGKVPALATEDGDMLYDSRVICEYLDSLGDGPKLFPNDISLRWQALRLQALGDGMMDAGVAMVVEASRPSERQMSDWRVRQHAALQRCLDQLERDVSTLTLFTIGSLSVAAALSYLDFRFHSDNWFSRRPALAAWYAVIERHPSMVATQRVDPSYE